MTNPPDLPSLKITVPEGFHAFLIAVARIHDPGSGDLVDLEIPGGVRLRARAGADVLRLGERIGGVWRTTLHFATARDGQLSEPVHLHRVAPIQTGLESLEPAWSAAGKLVRLDPGGTIVLRVYPERARRTPFLVHAVATKDQLATLEGAVFARVGGGMEGATLVVREAVPISLSVPERWKGWKPARKGNATPSGGESHARDPASDVDE